MKVARLLSELALPFTTIPVDIFQGAQHAPELRATGLSPVSGQAVLARRSEPLA